MHYGHGMPCPYVSLVRCYAQSFYGAGITSRIFWEYLAQEHTSDTYNLPICHKRQDLELHWHYSTFIYRGQMSVRNWACIPPFPSVSSSPGIGRSSRFWRCFLYLYYRWRKEPAMKLGVDTYTYTLKAGMCSRRWTTSKRSKWVWLTSRNSRATMRLSGNCFGLSSASRGECGQCSWWTQNGPSVCPGYETGTKGLTI